MKIVLNLGTNKFNAENVEAEQANKIIDGFFNNLNETPATVELTPTAPQVKAVVKAVAKQPVAPMPPAPPVPKQTTKLVVPLLGSENTSSTSIGELIGDKIADLATPIDYSVRVNDDGVKLYQAHYVCDCGHTGKRFTPDYNKYVKCHDCGEKLLLEPATMENDEETGLPKQDNDGNYFVARELY